MKLFFIFLITFFTVSCQTVSSSKVKTVSADQIIDNSTTTESYVEASSIRKIDFQNFTFPWTKAFGGKEKSFTLKNGVSELSDKRKMSLKSLTYVDVADDYEEQALITIDIEDGNTIYNMLYVYAIENVKPKLLESFEFGENNTSFGTAFDAHGVLIIETFHQKAGDAECCPSIVEISYYKWQKDKFVIMGEPQKIANGYLERVKKKR